MYWVGNAQYAQREFRASIATQRQLIATYPDSQKLPDALLNIASGQVELGDAAGSQAHARGNRREVSDLGSGDQGEAALVGAVAAQARRTRRAHGGGLELDALRERG